MTAQHFLVPIDFSAYADQALEYAIALAQKLQARLTLLHVIQPLPISGTDMGMGTVLPYTYFEELETALHQALEKKLQRVHQAGLEGDYVLVHGIPFQVIIDTAAAQHMDLIIMGTHGRTGLTHMLMGSVAEKVVRLGPCPVLVTRVPAETPELEAGKQVAG
jgi:nucleotide-binding universal stress UspA family protein